jgi:26S proteasome regulatory subunit T3
MRELERELELLSMQEEFLKDEQRHLKSEYIRSKEEVSLYKIWLIAHFRSSVFNLST